MNSDNEPDNVEGCNEDDVVSEYNGSDVVGHALPTKKARKRKQSELAAAQKNLKRPKKVIESVHIIQSVLSTWSEETDYGVAFRGMGDKEQGEEVVRLNKSAAKGTKDAMKLKTLNVMYKTLCSEKLRDYLIEQRPPPSQCFAQLHRVLIHIYGNLHICQSENGWKSTLIGLRGGIRKEGLL